MKKIIFPFFLLILLVACKSTKKAQNKSVGLKGFYTYYNTLFNGKEAYEAEINNRKKNHQDNFYTDYISLLPNEEPELNSEKSNELGPENSVFFTNKNAIEPPQTGGSSLQVTEAKALKAISKYSVIKNGEERNKSLFDAYILLAKARLMMNKPVEALDALNTLVSNMPKYKKLSLAKIYQAEAYTRLGDYYKAEEVFQEAQKDPKIKKSYAKLLSLYHAEMLLKAGKKEKAVEELEEAFRLNKNRQLRSRIAYLRGQILNQLGKNDEARASFTTAYKYANSFEFEVKAQVEIAKTFTSGDNYDEAKKYVEDISKKGVYLSRRNEFYYALGLMADKAGKKDEADAYFRKSLEGEASDKQIRGLAFYQIGKAYFDKDDYIPAGAYYDSAIAVMTYAPQREKLAEQTKNIKKITQNYYLIKKNDSILALTKMSDAEREAYFGKIIQELKEKEEKEERERRRAERSEGFDTGEYNANSAFTSGRLEDFFSPRNKGGFYFANASTVSKGTNDFKQIWGNRTLADNWRYSNKMGSIEDEKQKAMGVESPKDPRRFEVAFYTEKIPTDKEQIAQLKKDRDTASLGLGRMYESYLSKTPLATKTLYDLVDSKPEDEVKLQALYTIFSINYEKTPEAAERAKQLIIQDFPHTPYAEFVKNPKNTNFSATSDPEVQKRYTEAFNLYSEEKFEESKNIIETTIENYPKDALIPKFELLRAFNTGKTVGKEVMILQLEQLALGYPKTMEGEKAKQMLKYLKSDVQIEHTDDTGKKIDKAPEKKPAPERQKPISEEDLE